jgi:tRNA-specific 2-thiouridylase
MASLARAFGADRLVTGHYARLIERSDPSGPLLVGGIDPAKDQAYALARVPADVLAMMEFPLGAMSKAEVRAEARSRGLAVADTPDSQDLCFIAGLGRERFLEAHAGLKPLPGPIRSVDGQLLGTHKGHFNHTVGQRRGLSVGGGVPLYVTSVDADSNTVTVGSREQLLTRTVEIIDVDLRRPASRVSSARLRHRAPAGAVQSVVVAGDRGVIHFSEPVDRVAPGQIACLLDGDTLVGCATVAGAGA